MSRWFRIYDDLIDDPKVQRLSAELFRALINIWCLASKNDGRLPNVEEVAFKLRSTTKKAEKILKELQDFGLIDKSGTTLEPHNWSARQFKSDVSRDRVKRHRERKCNVTSPVTETPPDTDTETETETDTESRHRRVRETALTLGQQIVQAFEAANNPNLPDTSRADLWITQGFDPAIIVAVIRDVLSRNPNVSSLNYFDRAIRDAHEKRAPKIAPPQPVDWDARVRRYRDSGGAVWPKGVGPEPGYFGCQAPPAVLMAYGYELAA